MTNQNLPCPFCGCESILTGIEYLELRCSNYDCYIKEVSMPISKWNSRPAHPLEAKVEEYRKDLDEEIKDNSGTIFSDGLKLAKESFVMIFGEEK